MKAGPSGAARTTESSQRTTISRSCTRKASAMPASRSRASSLPMTSGSPPGLALVITSRSSFGSSSQPVPAGRPAASCQSSRWSGAAGRMMPSQASPGALPGNSAAPLRQSTTGASIAANNAASSEPTAASPAKEATLSPMTANGFSSRALRRRNSATASALRASQARWKPPNPLSATMPPARSRARVAATGSPGRARPSASMRRRRGPQSGQQVVSAWKRRSAGLPYSAAQGGHRGKGARLVRARS